MMNKRKSLLIFLLSIVFAFSALLFSLVFFRPAETVVGEATPNENIKDVYIRGERISLSGATIEVGKNTYESDRFEVVYPDGSAYSGAEYILNDIGDYEIRYYATNGDKEVSASVTFVVRNALFETTKETASAEFTDSLNLVKKIAGESEENSYITKSGIHAEITDSSEFRYNEPINLKELDKSTPFLRLYPYNRSAYAGGDGWQCDAGSIIIKLTDCYDSSNYVEIEISYDPSDTKVPDKKDPYLRAGASNQTKTGFQKISAAYDAGSRKAFYIGSQRYVSVTGMYGVRDDVNWADNADDTGFEFFYDYETNSVYMKTRKLLNEYRPVKSGETGTHFYVEYLRNGTKGKYCYDEEAEKYVLISDKVKIDPDFVAEVTYDKYGYFLTREKVLSSDPEYITNPPPKEKVQEYIRDGYKMSGVSNLLIADLDNEEAFDDVFKGFTTGETYLSVYGTDYENSVLRFEIDEIAGKKGEQLNEATVVDKLAPVIKIDEEVERAAKRYIVRGEKFVIPSAKAYDANLKGDVRAEVYYDYGTESRLRVGVYDGAFVPNKTGVYTIVYIATDVFGNVTKLALPFVSVTRENGKTIDFTANAPSEPVYAGIKTTLPKYSFTAINAVSSVYVSAYAVYDKTGEKIIIDDTLSVMFTNSGKYTVYFTYGDLFYEYTYSYDLEVYSSDAVNFRMGMLPDYFIKDATYTLEKVYALTYKGEQTENEAEVFVSEDGGEWIKIDPKGYKVNADESVNFKYSFGGKTEICEKTVKVIDVGYGDIYKLQNYFVGDFEKDAVFNGVTFASRKTLGANSLEFINVLSLSAFSLQFSVPEDKSQYDALEITLTDYYDRTKSVALTYAKGKTGIEFNGKTVSGGFTDTRTLVYSEERKEFSGQAGELYVFTENFTSDKVLLTFTLKDLNGEGGVFIRSLNGQSINSTDYDYVGPTVWYDLSAKGIKKLGETVTLAAGIPFDVLSPYDKSNFKFSVVYPSGRYAVATDGTVLDESCDPEKTYSIKLTEFGTYSVNYVYSDVCGNRNPISFNIMVVDEIPPEITLEDGYNEKTIERVKVGEKVTIKKYTVTDDMTAAENLNVYILVLTPNSEMMTVTDSFVATEKGDYTVIYSCYDDYDNYTVKYYTVRAS